MLCGATHLARQMFIGHHAGSLVKQYLARSPEGGDDPLKELAQIGGPAVPFVSPLLRHPDWRVRREAVKALGKIRAPGLAAMAEPLLHDRCWIVRTAAVAALGRIHDRRSVGPLARALRDPSPHVRSEVALILGYDFREEDPAAPLHEAFLQEKSQCVRVSIALALACVPSDSTIPWAVGAIGDHSWQIRFSAARMLAKADVRLDSVGALAPAVTDPSLLVRYCTVRALGKAKGDDAVPLLAAALADSSHRIRSCAVESLRRLGSKRSARALRGGLDDPSPFVRRQVVRALACIGDETALPALVEAACDRSQAVRECALMAIWHLAGEGVDGYSFQGQEAVKRLVENGGQRDQDAGARTKEGTRP